MRKCITLIFTLAFLLTIQAPASAQDTRVGIGVGIGSQNLALSPSLDDVALSSPLGLASVYLPITLSSLRIEPEVSFLRASSSTESGDFETSTTSTAVVLASGVFAGQQRGNTYLYYGGRLGVSFSSTTEESSFGNDSNEETTSRTNFFVGPAVGGEYFFSDHFSLGGEAQLRYLSIGEPQTDDDDDEETDESNSLLRTLATFFVRWHL